jgi:hypothetical protein
MEAEQKVPFSTGANTTHAQLASVWMRASTSIEQLQQLAQRHSLTQHQLQVLLNVQRQPDSLMTWRIITLPESAGMLAGHMIVELKQQHVESEQELGATHSITRCVYTPSGASLPAKDSQLLITQHVMSTQNRLRRLEQQQMQLLADTSARMDSDAVTQVKSEEPTAMQQQQQQQFKADPYASALLSQVAAALQADQVTAAASSSSAAADEPDTPRRPDAAHICTPTCSCCTNKQSPQPQQEQEQEDMQHSSKQNSPVPQQQQQQSLPQREQQQASLLPQQQQQQQQQQQEEQQSSPVPMLVEAQQTVNPPKVSLAVYMLCWPNTITLTSSAISLVCTCSKHSLLLRQPTPFH